MVFCLDFENTDNLFEQIDFDFVLLFNDVFCFWVSYFLNCLLWNSIYLSLFCSFCLFTWPPNILFLFSSYLWLLKLHVAWTIARHSDFKCNQFISFLANWIMNFFILIVFKNCVFLRDGTKGARPRFYFITFALQFSAH